VKIAAFAVVFAEGTAGGRGLRLVPLATGGRRSEFCALPVVGVMPVVGQLSSPLQGAWMVRAPEHCPHGHRLMPGRMLLGSIACSCGQAHRLAMRLRRRHLRGTAGRRMQLARPASARPPANLPGSQRAPTPVDSHPIDARTSTDRDVLVFSACALNRHVAPGLPAARGKPSAAPSPARAQRGRRRRHEPELARDAPHSEHNPQLAHTTVRNASTSTKKDDPAACGGAPRPTNAMHRP
jgi:hypothetical protein